jgi:hypothetical protein
MIVDRDFNLSLLPDSIKMQMGERRDWQSVKLPRQAGQPEQRFPSRGTDNVCTSRMGRVIALAHVLLLPLFCHFDT